jgi:hypothetical protein
MLIALSDDPFLKVVCQFHFKKADVDAMTEYLGRLNRSNLFLVNDKFADMKRNSSGPCFLSHNPQEERER